MAAVSAFASAPSDARPRGRSSSRAAIASSASPAAARQARRHRRSPARGGRGCPSSGPGAPIAGSWKRTRSMASGGRSSAGRRARCGWPSGCSSAIRRSSSEATRADGRDYRERLPPQRPTETATRRRLMVAPGRPACRWFTAYTSASPRRLSSWARIGSEASTCAVPPSRRRPAGCDVPPRSRPAALHHLAPRQPQPGPGRAARRRPGPCRSAGRAGPPRRLLCVLLMRRRWPARGARSPRPARPCTPAPAAGQRAQVGGRDEHLAAARAAGPATAPRGRGRAR